MKLINLPLLKQPLNWVIVFLMVLFFVLSLELLTPQLETPNG